MNLPQIGTGAQFAALRNFLVQAGYTEPHICTRLGLPTSDALDIISLSDNLAERIAAPEQLNTLIRLFLLGEFVAIAELETQFPGSAWAAMNALGLIEEHAAERSKCAASVALYPVGDLLIISDRWNNPDHTLKQSFPDIVYPAMTKSTREFLRFLPHDACGDYLELCGGSGIAALFASRYARNSWAADITERSTHFAAFNIALNDLHNVSAVQGDLYGPFPAQTFDRITAHPPYMPVLRAAEIYYDGGEDGEQLTRRILQGLREHLKPGGRLYCRTLGTDRETGPFEKRLRGWLGEAEDEFDIALFISKNLDPARFALDSAVRRSTGQAEVNQWKGLFERLGVKDILTGTVVVQRREGKRRVFTIRRSLAQNTDSAATEEVLRWETELAYTRTPEKFFGIRPLASPRMHLTVQHRIQEGEFTAQDFTLASDYPFLMDCQIQPWIGYLLARCDGSRTVGDLYRECQEAGWIQTDTPPLQFIDLVGMFVSGGFLKVDGITSPGARE